MTLVWERAPYTAGSLLVLLALADWANDDGIAWPSMERLAMKARIDKRSAQRIVRQLAKDGTIEIDEGGGRGKQHRYLIQTETMTKRHPLEEAETVTPVSPITEIKGDILNTKTVTFEAERVTSDTQTVTPVSPDPLVEPLEEPSLEPSGGLPFSSPEFRHAFARYEQHRKEKRSSLTKTARSSLYEKLRGMGEGDATLALKVSVEQGWTGVFAPQPGSHRVCNDRGYNPNGVEPPPPPVPEIAPEEMLILGITR